MKIIARPNEHDLSMIELYSEDMRYMLGAVHVDNFIVDESIYATLRFIFRDRRFFYLH